MIWNWMVQTCGASAVYVALMGAYLADISQLAFALYSAFLLSLGLVFHTFTSSVSQTSKTAQSLQSVIPPLSESMAELHSLQIEINELQAQFTAETKSRRTKPSNSASDRWKDHE